MGEKPLGKEGGNEENQFRIKEILVEKVFFFSPLSHVK